MTHEIAAAWIIGGFIMVNRPSNNDRKIMGVTGAQLWGMMLIFTLTFVGMMS